MNGISALGTLVSGIDFGSRQGYAVARVAMDQARTEGEAAVRLIKAASEVGKRPTPDPTGTRGRTIDTYA